MVGPDQIVAGEPAAIAQARRWIRGAASPYRRVLAGEIEDLEQEVLVVLVQSIREGRFEERSSLSTYTRRIVHNMCINRMRVARRRTFVPTEDVRLESRLGNPGNEQTAHEELTLALRVVAALPETCREVWAMLLDGLGYQEMSRRVDVSPGTLRVRVSRCRARAHEIWEELTGSPR